MMDFNKIKTIVGKEWAEVFKNRMVLFSVLFLLFLRFLPLMAMAEIKAISPQADPHAGHDHDNSAAHH